MESAAHAWLLLGGGFVAGIVNVLAGAGSLLTVPLLVMAGLPGTLANGSNRIGVFLGSGVAAWRFRAEGVSGFGHAVPVLVPIVIGSAAGAFAASRLDDALFERVFGALMLLLLIPILRPPREQPVEWQPERLRRPATVLLFLAIGLYGGAFQAGVGILLVIAVSAAGIDLVRANSVKVVVNLALTGVAIPVYLAADQIVWIPALVLGTGFALGAVVGTRLAVRGGERLVRPVIALAVVALAGRMLGLY